jgi:hypothetical protein
LTSLQQLLASIVDYAGLFPPAQLNLTDAMQQYDRAQSAPHHWMLDRFVLPAAYVPELSEILLTFPKKSQQSGSWALSVILSKNWAAELDQIRQFTEAVPSNEQHIHIEAWEIAPIASAEIQSVYRNLPETANAFFEIPFDVELEPYLHQLQQTGAAAKLRTGGMISAAFPDSAQLSQRILLLAKAQIPFKATAGLHHALRGTYPLTDQSASASSLMHGFLNVALLAAFANQQRLTIDQAWALLEERSIASFQLTETEITWRDRALSIKDIQHSRHQFRSIGSCSVQEPIEDLHSLNLL